MARDRLGIKPLYYSFLPNGTLAFGSELKALMQHPALPRRIDPQAVEDYFSFGYIPDPKTLYHGVHKLAPGHVLTLRRGEETPRVHQYWDVAFEPNHSITEADAMVELENDKPTVLALREIADGLVTPSILEEIEQPATEDLMQSEPSDDILPMRGISIGD